MNTEDIFSIRTPRVSRKNKKAFKKNGKWLKVKMWIEFSRKPQTLNWSRAIEFNEGDHMLLEGYPEREFRNGQFIPI